MERTINVKYNDYLIALNKQGITELNCELVNKRTGNHARQSEWARTVCTAYLLGELKDSELPVLLGRWYMSDTAVSIRDIPTQEDYDKVLRRVLKRYK